MRKLFDRGMVYMWILTLVFFFFLRLINNQIKKYCIPSNDLSKIFEIYDSNIHALSKFLKYLLFEDFRFYFSIYYNKIKIQQI